MLYWILLEFRTIQILIVIKACTLQRIEADGFMLCGMKAKQEKIYQRLITRDQLTGELTWNAKDSLSTHDGLSSAFPRGQFNAYAGDTLAIFWRDTSAVSANDWDIQMVVSQDGELTGVHLQPSTLIQIIKETLIS